MFVFYDSTGKIIGGCAANSPNVVLTRIPDGTTALYLDDTTNANVWSDMGEFVIQAGTPVFTSIPDSIKLANAQQSKIQEVTNAYVAQLNSTFTSSATGTALVYSYSPNSQNLWKELSDAINSNYFSDAMFPMNITLKNGSTVPHTKLQLQQIFGEIANRKMQLYGKLQGMIITNGSIASCTTINKVNTVNYNDTTAPAVPVGLSATATSLTCTSNTEVDLYGYNFYKSTDNITFTKINSSVVQTLPYTISGLITGTTYYFKVSAIDVNGNESVQSTSVSIVA